MLITCYSHLTAYSSAVERDAPIVNRVRSPTEATQIADRAIGWSSRQRAEADNNTSGEHERTIATARPHKRKTETEPPEASKEAGCRVCEEAERPKKRVRLELLEPTTAADWAIDFSESDLELFDVAVKEAEASAINEAEAATLVMDIGGGWCMPVNKDTLEEFKWLRSP